VSPAWPGWLSTAISRRFTCSRLTADSISVRAGPIPARRSDFFLLALPMSTKPIKDRHQPGPASTLNPQVLGVVQLGVEISDQVSEAVAPAVMNAADEAAARLSGAATEKAVNQ
jgi:hypothetical protein